MHDLSHELAMEPADRRGDVRATAWFFAAAFAITWSLQLPAVLAQRGILAGPVERYMPFVGLGVLGPTVAAVLVARSSGRGEARALFRSLRDLRAHPGWYLVALALPGATFAIPMALYALVRPDAGPALYLPESGGRVVAAIVISFGEEIGWRGFALPRLSRAYGALAASVILGVAWAVWHVPMFLGVGIGLELLPVMALFFVPGSVVFTWIWARTGGSLLLVVLAHVGAHLNNSHRALPGDVTPLVVHTVGYWIAALAIVALDRETFGARVALRLARRSR